MVPFIRFNPQMGIHQNQHPGLFVNTRAIGITRKVAKGPSDKRARPRMHTVCGILRHSSLAVTPGGLPLGLPGIKLWTRKKFKGSNALKGRGPDASAPLQASKAGASGTRCRKVRFSFPTWLSVLSVWAEGGRRLFSAC